MERNDFFRSANAFAMQYGAIFGLWLTIGFTCVIGMFTFPLLSLFHLVFMVSIPVLGGYLTLRYLHENKKVTGTPLSFGQIFLYTTLQYYYAAILFALCVYVYFAFIDNGFFITSYINYLNLPEVKKELAQPSMQQLILQSTGGNGIDSLAAQLQLLTPVNYALVALTGNIIVGLILSIPTALFCKSKSQNRP